MNSQPGDPVTDENERLVALDFVQQEDPDSHHLTCTEITVTRTAPLSFQELRPGEGFFSSVWLITCPHGYVSDINGIAMVTYPPDSKPGNPQTD